MAIGFAVCENHNSTDSKTRVSLTDKARRVIDEATRIAMGAVLGLPVGEEGEATKIMPFSHAVDHEIRRHIVLMFCHDHGVSPEQVDAYVDELEADMRSSMSEEEFNELLAGAKRIHLGHVGA